jgi:hypothetical protein
MALYVPNVGELEALKAIINSMAIELGLYKTQIIPDGNTVVDTISELPTGSGRGYARKTLTNTINESAAAADKWYVTTNSLGRAEGQYGLTAGPQEFTFAAADVADGNTIYGAFAFAWVLPFDAGLAAGPIKVGDTINGETSGATGIVTAVILLSGTWGAGTAAGYLYIKTKTGTFVDNETIRLVAVPMATSNTGATGDAHKKLVFVEAFSQGYAIDTAGQKLTYLPKITMATS